MHEALASLARLPVFVALLLSVITVVAFPSLRRMGAAGARRFERSVAALRRIDVAADAGIWRLASGLLIVGSFGLVSVTSGAYGYNVDEWWQSEHGVALADWYARTLSGAEFREFSSNVEEMNHYGGFFELLAELVSRASPLGHTATRHLVTAWFGVLGLLGAYLLGSSLHSRATGFVTALLLLLTPRFYGHFFSNPKDLPFAVCMIFSLLVICRALPALPRLPVVRVLTLGAVIGAGMAVRVGGVIALLYFWLALSWWLGGEIARARGRGGWPAPRDLLTLAGTAVGVTCSAWVVMLIFWPWAQSAPLQRPLESLGYFQDVVAQQQVEFAVFFEGRIHRLSQIPRYFTLKWLLISMPEIALLAPIAAVALAQWLRGWQRAWPRPREMAWLLITVSIVLPLATTANRGVIQYDGIRHFLFVLPPLTLILAASLVATLYGSMVPRLKAGVLVLAISLSAVTAWDMWVLHPYQYVYFNRGVAGGVRRAAQRFETDYLGLSYREGLRWVLANYEPRGSPPARIATCLGFNPNLLDGLAMDPSSASRFRAVPPRAQPEIAVAFTRGQCHQRFRGRVLKTVERGGTPLLYVIELAAHR
jgi:hypothetical protein